MSSDSRETLKSFLSSLGTTSTMISYAPSTDESDDDLGVEPHVGKDLVDLDSDITGLLGDWLEYLLDNAIDGNVYNLKGKNTKMPSPKRGVALEPAESTGAKNVFVESTSIGGLELSKYSNSGKFDDPKFRNLANNDPSNPSTYEDDLGPLMGIVDKKMGVDGHSIYSDIEGGEINKTGKLFPQTPDTSEKKIPSHSSAIIGGYNRFSAAEATAATAELGNADRPNVIESPSFEQDELGAWSKDTQAIKFDNIRRVGLSLLLKAAGYDKAATAAGSVDPDKFEELLTSDPEYQAGFENSWKTPGNTVSTKLLEARYAYGAPSSAALDKRNGEQRVDVEDGKNSFGTTTTPWTPFDQINAGPIIAQAIASTKALLDLVKKLDNDIVSTLGKHADQYDGKTTIGRGPLWKGTSDHGFSGMYRLLKIQLLAPTDYPYSDCVTSGADFLFGKKFGSINTPSEAFANHPMAWSSPGYLVSLARSITRSGTSVIVELNDAAAQGFTKASTEKFMRKLKDSNIFGFMNSLAIVGNIVKRIDKVSADAKMPPPWNVDMLADGPATRQAKSRSGMGVYHQSMAWRNSAVPSVFLLPNNLLYAANQLGNQLQGASPFRGHMGSTLADKTYFGRKVGTGEVDIEDSDDWLTSSGAAASRIPDIVVRRMEDLLEAEYVPFYFHDLRTGEIVAFNAFISSLSDSFSAQSTPMSGYGRVDPIHIYKSTQRTVSFEFYIVATNPEDFDEMWFKINKLTTLIYPKYDPGTRVSVGAHRFTMPFSQVPTGTPVVRVRIGDVIKSNYSKFGLARLFGVGDVKTVLADPIGGSPANPAHVVFNIKTEVSQKIQAVAQQIFLTVMGSPLATIYDHGSDSGAMRLIGSALTAMLKNGFMNPLFEIYANMMRDPDAHGNPAPGTVNLSGLIDEVRSDTGGFGYKPVLTGGVLLKPSMDRGYCFDGGGGVRKYYTAAHYQCQVIGRLSAKDLLESVKERDDNSGAIISDTVLRNMSRSKNGLKRTIYKVHVMDFNAPVGILFETAYVTHADLCPSPGGFVGLMLFLSDPLGGVFALARWAINSVSQGLGIPGDEVQSVMGVLLPDAAKFLNGNPAANFGMGPNPITHAFESTRGRGLAGVLDGMKFTWVGDNIPWSVDLHGRAPMIAKISTGLKVIHDLPPGLGHGGYNRAPIYPVGKIMHEISGDVYDDHGQAGAAEFKTARRKLTRKGE